MSSGLPSVVHHFALERARIDAGEAFFHQGGEQANMRNFAKMFGDEPDRFFRGHPMETIESGKIYRA